MTNEMNASSILHLFDCTKEQRESFANQVITAVKDGATCPLRTKILIKNLQEILEVIDKETREEQLAEAEKYGEKKFSFLGARIEIGEVGTKYDYSVCNNPEWAEANNQEKEWSGKRKAIEGQLQKMTKPQRIVNDDGEVIELLPPAKTSKTALKISLK